MPKTADKPKQAKPPEGWEPNPGVTWADDQLLVASRTYPDGTRRELTADNPEAFKTTAAETDIEVGKAHAARHAAIHEQIRELQAQIDVLASQAEQYEWAV